MLIPLFRPLPVVLALTIGWLATGCGSDQEQSSRDPSDEPTSKVTVPTVQPVEGAEPRLAVTYDGGVLVVRATDGSVVSDLPVPGFVRVNPAGDERHVLVSAGGAFTALDLGVWSVDHGDHDHSYADEPSLTDFAVPAVEAGHVVAHHGWTTLFDDGTGTMTAFESDDLADLATESPELETATTPEAHHGVAVRGEDGGWLHTVGTAEERSGIRLVSADGEVLASSDECPGVHGETFAAGEVAAFGCEDGVLLADGETVTKVQAPDAYGRIGNLAGTEESPYVLGDYKSDPDAELERPTRVSLVDTRDASLRLVDLGTSYSFRSLGRGPTGEPLVLGTDGALHVLDPETGSVAASVPVVAGWREPTDWERPRPTLEVVGELAYVTEPETSTLHVVDLTSLEVVASHVLPRVPNELVGVTG